MTAHLEITHPDYHLVVVSTLLVTNINSVSQNVLESFRKSQLLWHLNGCFFILFGSYMLFIFILCTLLCLLVMCFHTLVIWMSNSAQVPSSPPAHLCTLTCNKTSTCNLKLQKWKTMCRRFWFKLWLCTTCLCFQSYTQFVNMHTNICKATVSYTHFGTFNVGVMLSHGSPTHTPLASKAYLLAPCDLVQGRNGTISYWKQPSREPWSLILTL